MIGADRLLMDRQRSLEERLGIGVAPLVVVEESQIVKLCYEIGILSTAQILVDHEQALSERNRIGVFALTIKLFDLRLERRHLVLWRRRRHGHCSHPEDEGRNNNSAYSIDLGHGLPLADSTNLSI